jgi:GrpB protein
VKGHWEISDKLAFRDYLRAHSSKAAEYGELKRRIAVEHRLDNIGYMRAKNRDEWNLAMDVDISTVVGEPARSCTDAHADGGTFVSRKATIGGFTANPTRTFFANALKADRNHRIVFICELGSEIIR